MTPLTSGLRVESSLDLRGKDGPSSYRLAVAKLSTMAENEVLEIYLDEGGSLRNTPYGLRALGHEILVSETAHQGVRLLIRKRTLLS
ncbi:MAG: sulfurtransferase TusA family protein [Candidatus Omnitrophica bacterium]|nr:sulfurtransferase TusA family protein [Candidatus Omnitrophota bacterium]MBI2174644.1 sulfurtransferase TusA family protein [Candidatus Omnitrophota bacterium]MBI3009370.1 sulfurtransferase TusA family protein [Candidatus Omnitrophota bacterium]